MGNQAQSKQAQALSTTQEPGAVSVPAAVMALPSDNRFTCLIREYLSYAAAHEYARCLGILGDHSPAEASPVLTQRLEGVVDKQFYSIKELADRITEMAAADGVSEQELEDLKRCLNDHIQACCAVCVRYLESTTARDPLNELTTSLLASLKDKNLCWPPDPEALPQRWGEWSPGFSYDDLSVDRLKQSLPGFPESGIPAIVKQYEDPSSPHALIGAVTLAHHDIIHILLGRGLLDQDEAFVLGFTMGTASRGDIEGDLQKMRNLLGSEYQEPFRIPAIKLKAFDLGVQCAQRSSCKDIFLKPLTDPATGRKTVAQLRQEYGIDKQVLLEFYARERAEIPGTLESLRLA